eukprot:6188657-Pleurochrysis_carterae.AAC.1
MPETAMQVTRVEPIARSLWSRLCELSMTAPDEAHSSGGGTTAQLRHWHCWRTVASLLPVYYGKTKDFKRFKVTPSDSSSKNGYFMSLNKTQPNS